MSKLLSKSPYSNRDETLFLEEMNQLTSHHMKGSEEYRRIFPEWNRVNRVEELPYLHVGLFKNMDLKTHEAGIKHERIVRSSSTTGKSSMIASDRQSLTFQAESARKILVDFIGERKKPVLILDSTKSLYKRKDISARIAAAMSLRPLATEIYFLLNDSEDAKSVKYEVLLELLNNNDELMVYGFTWILWLVWSKGLSKEIIKAMKDKKITFITSGGWKKLEDIKVDHATFNACLLKGLKPCSKVLDYYGLVEQLGIIYPLCEYGSRHVPVWADIIIRDTYTLKPLDTGTGQLQLLNTIAFGAPYHNVLTEDIGSLIPGDCPCGRKGKRFELKGRLAKSELRGCANV